MLSIAHAEGAATIRTPAAAFVPAFAQRIRKGLLGGAARRRDRYSVTREESECLVFRAQDWPTATNVGLNDVELTMLPGGRVRYSIAYNRWAAYALGLCGIMGLAFVVLLLTWDVRGYIQRHAASRVPGLSLGQNVAVAWAMAVFLGFVWPWILIGLHRRPVRRLLERIIAEVDASGGA